MAKMNSHFGKVLNFDPALLSKSENFQNLSLRRRGENFIVLLNADNFMLTIVDASQGRGPNRVVTDKIPMISEELPTDNWAIKKEKLIVPYFTQIFLNDGESLSSEVLPPIRDFPGHMRLAVNRALRPIESELQHRMGDVARALKTPLAEAVEAPVLRVIGFGPGAVPAGDRALAGLLLTGRAFFVGRHFKAKWLGRLTMEVRRFLHRTTIFAQSMIQYALEGRTTKLEEEFFLAMQKDFEGAVDMAVKAIREDDPMGGAGFLFGVQAALALIHRDMYPELQKEHNCEIKSIAKSRYL